MTASVRPPLRIATRASRLALWQAHHVASLLRRVAAEVDVEVIEVSTAGDRDRTEPLSQMEGLGVFTREVQAAVLDKRADVTVHSLKDLPTETVDGLTLAGVPTRGPRYDVLVLPADHQGPADSPGAIPHGARIGTGSLRRRAQLQSHRPDLVMTEIRGNVETRLQKLDEGRYDAIILAQAGLQRLELSERVSLLLQPPLMYPAVGQAALGIECRTDDAQTKSLLQQITDVLTMAEVSAERTCLHELRAGCHAPVGVLTVVANDDRLRLKAVVLSSDGQERVVAEASGDLAAAEELGRRVAGELLQAGADRLLSAGKEAQ